MNHQDAIEEMAAERYLLGELSGTSLDRFEEHLFECPECALDVKTGFTFLDGAKTVLDEPRLVDPSKDRTQEKRVPIWVSWFTSPWVLAPALAACLIVLAFQTLILQPRMKLEMAQAHAPAILAPLVLANAGPRGDSVPEVLAPPHGSFLISLDVPSREGFSSYQCSLYTPEGKLAWQTAVSPEQARDALLISVPTDKVTDGLNTFLIQGVTSGDTSGAKLEALAKYRFQVKIQK